MAKEMEGDNQQRRQLARQARQQDLNAGTAGVSLGGSKQRAHAEKTHRHGPPAAGARKLGPQAPRPHHDPDPSPDRPAHLPRDVDRGPDVPVPRLRYQELVDAVASWAGLSFDEARDCARVCITVLAGTLPRDKARLLREAMPAELLGEPAVRGDAVAGDARAFVGEVARRSGIAPEQARLRAEAVCTVISDEAPDLLRRLGSPSGLVELAGSPMPGGGLVGPDGHSAPLEDEEVRRALDRLPQWTGGRWGLQRTVVSPPDQLDRLLGRLEAIKQETGRGPRVSRPDGQTAVLLVRTAAVSAVTAADLDLVRRIDREIAEPGR